jgi:hypothetical protein
VTLFKPKTLVEAYVQAHYLESMSHEKGKPSGSKQKEHLDASKEGKKKWKGTNKKMIPTAHQ